MLTHLILASLLARVSQGCVFLWGTSPDSQAPHPAGSSYDYKTLGDDWVGVDGNNNSWVCLTGTQQSPIIIPLEAVNGDASLRTTWQYPTLTSNGTNLEIINNGHVIQVEWTYPYVGSAEYVAVDSNTSVITSILSMPNAAEGTKKVTGMPLQFHFHTSSEHYMFGDAYPLELHIVSSISQAQMPGCPASGCLSVTGVLFELTEDKHNPYLDTIFNNLPLQEGVINFAPAGATIELEAFLPPLGSRSYYQYSGSLTTPPCTEGLLWHVFKEPSYMSVDQYRQFMMAVNNQNCTESGNSTGHSHRRLASAHSQSHAHEHGHAHAGLVSHSHRSLKSALEVLPKSLEVRVAELPRLRRDSEGHLILESNPHRVLVADDHGSGSDWVCVTYSYAQNHRMPQPINGRIVKFFADPVVSTMYDCAMSMNETWVVQGKKIGSEIIKSVNYAFGDHAMNQQRCKNKCDKKANCDGFLYETTRKCTFYTDITGWKDASHMKNFYDSCRMVEDQ